MKFILEAATLHRFPLDQIVSCGLHSMGETACTQAMAHLVAGLAQASICLLVSLSDDSACCWRLQDSFEIMNDSLDILVDVLGKFGHLLPEQHASVVKVSTAPHCRVMLRHKEDEPFAGWCAAAH